MDNKVFIESCEECSKENVCKFIDDFKQYRESIKKLAKTACALVRTNVSCIEYSKKVITIRALNPQGAALYTDYGYRPDDGTVYGNHD